MLSIFKKITSKAWGYLLFILGIFFWGFTKGKTNEQNKQNKKRNKANKKSNKAVGKLRGNKSERDRVRSKYRR